MGGMSGDPMGIQVIGAGGGPENLVTPEDMPEDNNSLENRQQGKAIDDPLQLKLSKWIENKIKTPF